MNTTITGGAWNINRLTSTSLTPWIVSLIALYLLVVRVLRYRAVNAMETEFANKKGKPLTPAQAQKILSVPMWLDMPFIFIFSQGYTFFKTYGIPTTASMIHSTKQLKMKETGGKRFVDTATLMSAVEACPMFGPGSGAFLDGTENEMDPRHAIALSRVNWIHSHYKIPNDDFIYDLSLFVFEPVRMAERWGWRSYTPLEREAAYVFWAEIGRRMGIQDIPPSYEELAEFAEAYERENMVPDKINAAVGRYSMDALLRKLPDKLGIRAFGRRVFICLLEERLRKAMMLPKQPLILYGAVRSVLQFHGFFSKHFCLPRRKPYYYFVPPNVSPDSASTDENGVIVPRARLPTAMSQPWYFQESTGIWKVLEKIQVAIGLADSKTFAGPLLQSEGYRLEELGPPVWIKSDHVKVMEMAADMQGVPVKGPWSLDYAKGVGCPVSH